MTTLSDRPNTALLVVDVQNGVVADAHERDAVVTNIAGLVEKARQQDVLVVWVQHSDEGLSRGSDEWRIVAELVPGAGEPLVEKHYGDSFEDTTLESVLADGAVGRLVVTGAETDACVRSTLHGAFVRGYDTTLVIPGDIPLITSLELARVLDAAPDEGVVIVPAYDRRGSNCVLRRPANLIPLRFGNDSFLPHCEAVRKTGKPLVILEMPGIGLDIDQPHELQMLYARGGDTHAQRLLRAWGFSAPPTQAWEAAG